MNVSCTPFCNCTYNVKGQFYLFPVKQTCKNMVNKISKSGKNVYLGPIPFMLRAHNETHYTHYLLEYQNSLYLSTLLWWPYLVYHNLFLLRGLCFLGIPDLFPGNGGKQVNRSCHPTVSLKETRLLINAVHWILREWNMSTVESFVRILGNQFWCYVSRDYTF